MIFQRQIVLTFILIIFHIIGIAQSTMYHLADFISLKKAISFYANEEYSAANIHLQEALKELPPQSYKEYRLVQNEIKFYNAICAAKLSKSNAENLLIEYINTNGEGPRSKEVHFNLATIYFAQSQYSKAVEQFDLSDRSSLSKNEREQFNFQNGYALFNAKKYTEADAFLKPLLSNTKGKYYTDAVYYSAIIDFQNKKFGDAEKGFLKIQDIEKYKFQIPFILCQIYYQQKEYDKVIAYIEPKINNIDQNVTEINHILGQSYFEKGNFKKALPYLDAYIEKNSRVTPQEMYQIAYCEYKSGKYKEAIKHFKELQFSDGALAQNSLYALADCYLKNDQKKEARACFASVMKYDEDKVIKEESEFNYAKLSYELNDDNEAVISLKKFIEKYQKSAHINDAYNLLTQQLISTKNYPEAIELMEEFDEFSAEHTAIFQKINYYYAVELYNDNKKDKAEIHLEKSNANSSNNEIEGQATFLLGEIAYGKGRYKDAIKLYASAYQIMKASKGSFDNYTHAKALYGRAYSHYKLKEYGTAGQIFAQSVSAYNVAPKKEIDAKLYPDAIIRQGDCAFITKNYEQARTLYASVSNTNMTGADYALLQKATLDGLLKNDNERISSLTYLIANYKHSNYLDDALYQLGSAYEENKEYVSAKQRFEQLLKSYTKSSYVPKALLKLGLISYNENKIDQSLSFYKRVSDNYPNSPESEQALKVIKEIYLSKGEADKYIDYIESSPNGVKISASAQDSLLFDAGEEAYANGDCPRTIQALGTYLKKFPNGFFASKAHFYKGECHYKDKKFDDAVADYAFVIEENKSPFLEKVLLKSVFYIYNQKKNYEKSYELYSKIKAIATNKQNIQIATLGLMRSSYYSNKYAENIKYADEVLVNPEFAQDIQIEANYYKAKSLFLTDKTADAKPLLEKMAKKSSSEKGAECKYLLGVIEYKNGEYNKSLDICFDLKDEFASYEVWVVKAFILIAENYHKQNDDFQAKATLESLLQNYDGDKALVAEAKKLLEEINESGKEKSKVDYK
jgi:TolA-binding protein